MEFINCSTKKLRDGSFDITTELFLNTNVFQEGDLWIGHSQSLDFTAQGFSEEEAIENFREAVLFFVEDLVIRGTLADVLSELGWEPRVRKARKSSAQRNRMRPIRITIPRVKSPSIASASGNYAYA